MDKQFLTADWNNLIMANYIIDAAILKNHLPAKTELDVYNGNVYLSLVGFMFQNTRVLGIKIPFHKNFEEVNLRFYVRYKDSGQWKRGVVFIKELVPKTAISFIANTLYHEKYSAMPMKHFVKKDEQAINLGYHWKHKNKWNKIEATTAIQSVPMLAGSEEEFIAEHYWGYSRYNSTTTFEYNVQHPAWQVYKVNDYLIDCDFTALYGNEFECLHSLQPNSVFVAKGSAIAVLKKRKL